MMTFEERKEQVKSYLGKTIKIKIDRPIGYVHNKESYSLTYPINYGYIPDVIAPDGGEELDVYLLGVNEPVEEYTAFIIGIVHRENDVEDKLVAVPDVFSLMTKEEIEKAIHFQEQYYDSHIEMLDVGIYNCVAQNCNVTGLPQRVAEISTNGIALYKGDCKFRLYSFAEFNEIMKLCKKTLPLDVIRSIWNHVENFEGQSGLFHAVYQAMKREKTELSPDAVFHLQIATYQNKMEMKIVKIED